MSVTTPANSPDSREARSFRSNLRRLFTNSAEGGNTNISSGIFDRARNTRINHASFVINQYGGEGQPLIVTGTPVSTPSTASSQNSSRRLSREVYVDCLITKQCGYPLWIPSPNMSLPEENRRLGVAIGDVGVLTPEGGFDFYFNVFYSGTHSINAAVGVPPGYVPFAESINSRDIQRFMEWNAGSYLADGSMVRVNNGRDQSKITLKTSAAESAVLMAPQDIHMAKLKNPTKLRRWVTDHMADWYIYIKHTLGHDIENGDLRVVYGCRKSAGYGIATVFNDNGHDETRLSFWCDEDRTSGCRYRWSHTGSAEVKAGPSSRDETETPSENMCLFVNTIDVKLSSGAWEQIETMGNPSVRLKDSAFSTSGATGVQLGYHKDGHSDSSSLPSAENSKHNNRQLGQTYHASHGNTHPSTILHYALERIAPEAKLYAVCDDDWLPVMTPELPNPLSFIDAIFAKNLIVEENDIVYFSDKEASNLEGLSQRDGLYGNIISLDRTIDSTPDTTHSGVEYRWERVTISSGAIEPNEKYHADEGRIVESSQDHKYGNTLRSQETKGLGQSIRQMIAGASTLSAVGISPLSGRDQEDHATATQCCVCGYRGGHALSCPFRI